MKRDKIPTKLFEKLKTNLPERTVYWRIQKKVKDYSGTITRRTASFLVAKDLDINFTKYLIEEDREELRKAASFSQPQGIVTTRIVEKEITKSLKPLKGIAPVEPYLPKELLDEAKEMAEKVYPLLYIFENTIRNVVKGLMEKKYGLNWWDIRVTKLHKDIETAVLKRMDEERQNRWHSSNRGIHKIFYSDLDDLRIIVIDNWAIFKNIHKRQSWVIEHIMQLTYSRNIIAHNNPLKKRDIVSIETKVHEWLDQIRALEI